MEVYVFAIGELRGREEEALSRLSPVRREKALRLRNENVRLLSVAAGLLLRRFVGEGPFLYGSQGKPYLPGGPGFSLSHSRTYAVLALDAADVGTDIELIAPPHSPALVRRVCAQDERDWLREDEARRFAFLWTRKEAALKWDGCGITYPLREVCVLPGQRPEVNGKSCELHTVEYNGYMISAAGREPDFVPRTVTWEEVRT